MDRDYVPIEGSNPPQYNNGFADFADKHVRPLLDRYKAHEAKISAAVITTLDGYLADAYHRAVPRARAGSGVELRAIAATAGS